MKTKIALVLLVMAGFMSVVLTVNSMNEKSQYDEAYYDVIESQYMDEVRSVLREHACFFSGITMTKITDKDGNRSYQVNINDNAFGRLDNEEKDNLIGKLVAIHFADAKAKLTIALHNNAQ